MTMNILTGMMTYFVKIATMILLYIVQNVMHKFLRHEEYVNCQSKIDCGNVICIDLCGDLEISDQRGFCSYCEYAIPAPSK